MDAADDPQFLLECDKNSCFLADFLACTYDNEVWFDMVIICSDGQMRAHKSVMAAASPFLRSLLESCRCEDTFLTMDSYK